MLIPPHVGPWAPNGKRTATAVANEATLSILFGDDVINAYRLIAERGTSAWRDGAKLTLSLCAENGSKPESERLPQMVIYQRAGELIGFDDGTVRGWMADEELFGERIDEFPGVVSRQHLRDIRGEAKAREVDPLAVWQEWVDQAATFGMLKPHSKVMAERRNGKTKWSSLVISARAANRNTSRMVKHITHRVNGVIIERDKAASVEYATKKEMKIALSPIQKKLAQLVRLKTRIIALAKRCEVLADETIRIEDE